MATNNRPLKSYIRYDGSGRAVSSSLIWRKNKPKVGNWKEVQGYECCDTAGCTPQKVVITSNVSDEIFGSPLVGITIQFQCSGFIEGFSVSTNVTNIGTGTIPTFTIESYDDIITFLNTNFSSVGNFIYLGEGNIQLTTTTEYTGCVNPIVFNINFIPAP